MNGLLESASTKAARMGAVDITAAFVKENLHHLSIVFAAPFEPTLQQDTIVYRDKESGQYYKLVRLRK